MNLTFTKEETDLLIELFNARIEYLKNEPLGSKRIHGFENVRDLLSIEGPWDYSIPQRVKMLSCLNEAKTINFDNSKKDILNGIPQKLHLNPKYYF